MVNGVPEGQREALDRIVDLQVEHTHMWNDYWARYSNFQTWQFWVHIVMLIGPLIVLFFLIDKKRALQIGFYGFNVHIWFTYVDILGTKYGLWVSPYQIYAPLPITFSLDASFIPIAYMLVYQWTINRKKNYYVFAGLLSIMLAFVFKPVLSQLGLFLLLRETTYLHLLAGYFVIMLISKWITDLFVHWVEKKETVTYV